MGYLQEGHGDLQLLRGGPLRPCRLRGGWPHQARWDQDPVLEGGAGGLPPAAARRARQARDVRGRQGRRSCLVLSIATLPPSSSAPTSAQPQGLTLVVSLDTSFCHGK